MWVPFLGNGKKCNMSCKYEKKIERNCKKLLKNVYCWHTKLESSQFRGASNYRAALEK